MTNQSELQRVFVLEFPLCEPHCCGHCGQKVDQFALHGLSCVKSKGRHCRHAAAQIPSTLEPNGHFRSDGKRPDGLTIAPWRMGHSLVWDATCPDTYAVSYIAHATREARAVVFPVFCLFLFRFIYFVAFVFFYFFIFCLFIVIIHFIINTTIIITL